MPNMCATCDHDDGYHVLAIGSDAEGVFHSWGPCLKPGCNCTTFVDSGIAAPAVPQRWEDTARIDRPRS